jgi:hypothetical protein
MRAIGTFLLSVMILMIGQFINTVGQLIAVFHIGPEYTISLALLLFMWGFLYVIGMKRDPNPLIDPYDR